MNDLPSIYDYLPGYADQLLKTAAPVARQPVGQLKPAEEAPHPYRRALQIAAVSGLGIGLGYMGGRAASMAVDQHSPLGQLPMFVGPALAWGAGYLAGKRQETSEEEMRRAYELKNQRAPGRLSR